MSELNLKVRVMRHLRENYPDAVMWKISDMYVSGIPDIVMVYKNKVLWIELKTEVGSLSKIQRYTLKKLRDNGARCFVVRSLTDLITILEYEYGKRVSRKVQRVKSNKKKA